MGAPIQEEQSTAPVARRWRLVSRLGVGIITLILLFLASNYHISRVNTVLESHRVHFEIQRIKIDQHAEVVRKGLQDLLDRSALEVVNAASLSSPEIEKRDTQTDERIKLATRGLLDSIESGISGLASSAESSVSSGISSLLPNISTTDIENDLVVPAKYMGVGLSSGILTGMNMTVKKDASLEANATGLNGMAENLGSGLTSTLVKSTVGSGSAINLSAILDGANGMVGQASLALAQGIGSGTASGLKLNGKVATAPTAPVYNISGISGIAGNFGSGLTTTLFGGIDLQQLKLPQANLNVTQMVATMSADPATMAMIAQAAAGLGIGLGQGSAVGLGLQDPATLTITGDSVKQITQNFASGLTSSFLENGTVVKLAGAFSPGGTFAGLLSSNSSSMFQNLNINQVAQGFAVGLVSGAGSVIPKAKIFSADTSSFNDSVQGASLGFGSGLGSEGAYLVSQILNLGATNPNAPTSNTSAIAPSAAPATVPAAVDPATVPAATNPTLVPAIVDPAAAPASTDGANAVLGAAAAAKKRFFHAYNKKVFARQDLSTLIPANITNATDISSFISSANASAINPMIQIVINDLTCTGVGGFAAVGAGLFLSGTLDPKKLQVSNIPKPDQNFQIVSDGNTYEINPAQGIYNAKVNGSKIVKFAVVLVLHIVFGIVVFFLMVPYLFGDHSRRNISSFFGGPMPLTPAWQKILQYSVYPSTLLILILGIVARGNAGHFNTVHGGLGFFIVLQTVFQGVFTLLAEVGPLRNTPKSPVFVAQKINIVLFLVLAEFLLASGFADISTLTLCSLQTVVPTAAVIVVALGLLTPILILKGSLLTEYYLRRRKGAATARDAEAKLGQKP